MATHPIKSLAMDVATWGAVGLAFFTSLGSWPLVDPDEGRNALVSLEMARSGDWLLPTLAGLPFLDKPFLYFATVAAAIRGLGATEVAVRLPSAIFALGIVAMTFGWARRELGVLPSRIAALACASIPLLLLFARIGTPDTCLSFCVVAAILAFERCIEAGTTPERIGSRAWNLAGWTAMAAGVLVKGPVALVVPLLVAAPYAIWRRQSSALWWPGGPALLAIVVVPWLVALEQRAPGFLHYAFVVETFQRVATNHLDRSEPFWYFVPFVLGAAFPWSWIALAGVRAALGRARESFSERRMFVFLALWLVLPLLFFSAVRSKRPQYIVPLLPALALAVGWLCSGVDRRLRGARIAAVGWLTLAAVAALALAIAGTSIDENALLLAYNLRIDRLPAARAFVGEFVVVAVLAGLSAWGLRRNAARAAWALAVPALILPWLARDLIAEAARTRSAREIVRTIEPRLGTDTPVIAVSVYPLSAAFYLDRPLLLSSANGEELTSNSILRDYEELAGRVPGNLRRGDYWYLLLDRGPVDAVFLTRARSDGVAQRLSAEGYRAVGEGRYRAWLPGTSEVAIDWPSDRTNAEGRR